MNIKNIDDVTVNTSWFDKEEYATRDSYVVVANNSASQYFNSNKESKVELSKRKCELDKNHTINI